MSWTHRTWATSDRIIPKTFVRPFLRFSQIEASSGIVLLGAAVTALVWANSQWSDSYFALLEQRLVVELGEFHFDESVQGLVNDGLMAIFFFVVGLEVKRELVLGELRAPRAAALPVAAAIGGMIAPAAIYLLMTAGGGSEATAGWGIPMATDIAFALGVVALLGSRVPAGAKLFLLAVAIVDDIGAIAVIAIFYTSELHGQYLAAAVVALAITWVASKVQVRALWFYGSMALITWYLTLESGIHATLAGVALALITPAHAYYGRREFDRGARAILDQFSVDEEDQIEAQEHSDHEVLLIATVARESVSPLSRLEHALAGWSSFVVVPIFALANAGVDFRGVNIVDSLTAPVALGVATGLIVGKPLGIWVATLIAVRLRLGILPAGMSLRHLFGLGVIAGIGFTVSLFVAGLAYEDPLLRELAKVGIFAGSLVSGLLGALILSRGDRGRPEV